MYKAIELFTDLQDSNFKYQPGDEFPRHGLKVTKKRINELLGPNNRRGRAVIEEVKEETEEEKPVKKTTPKKKGGKKANVK